MCYRILLFVALLATALALGGALAHAYELLNKLPLPRDEYFITQQIYAGWNRLAYILLVEAAALIALAIRTRHDAVLFIPVLIAFGALVAAQVVFWAWTFPANRATENWTAIPQNWEQLRRQWEYSHLAGAAFQLTTFAALVWATLARVRQPEHRPAS